MQSLLDKYKSSIETEIRQLEENRRQFLLDYDLHHLHARTESVPEQEADMVENDQMADEQSFCELENEETNLHCSLGRTEQPFIVYTLADQDILEDWSMLKMYNDLNRTVSTEC